MSNIFFISDTHFGHKRIITFTHAGTNKLIRPFASIEEHDEHIISCINKTVGSKDEVWHLGDVAWSVNELNHIMPRLKGQWNLIVGNHDTIDMKHYMKHFKIIRAAQNFRKHRIPFLATHYPIHPFSESITPNDDVFKFNLHGHIHEKVILTNDLKEPNTRYVCCSVEHTNYGPLSIEEVMERFK